MALELVQLSDSSSSEAPQFARELNVRCSDEVVSGCLLSKKIFDSDWFTSLHRLEDSQEFFDSTFHRTKITRDNPLLTERDRKNLDSNGMIEVGSTVESCDALVSAFTSESFANQSAKRDHVNIFDASWRVSGDWAGARVDAIVKADESKRKAFRCRYEVLLSKRRKLQLGDALEAGQLCWLVVGTFDQPQFDSAGNEIDLILPLNSATELGLESGQSRKMAISKNENLAAGQLQYRSTGAYSLITGQPLGRSPNVPQSIWTEHIEWLRARGLNSLVSEFVSLKADDLVHRDHVRQLCNSPAGTNLDIAKPTAPLLLRCMVNHLRALCLTVKLEDCDGFVRLTVRPATTDEIIQTAAGQVRKPETLNYRTLADEPDGLFAPNVFGPSNSTRRNTFGCIKLFSSIIPLIWRIGGDQSLLATATSLSGAQVEEVVLRSSNVYFQDGRVSIINTFEDEGVEAVSNGAEDLGTGVEGIKNLVGRLHGADSVETRHFLSWISVDTIPVLPPDWRPLVLLDSGNFATSDLNDHYRRIINRANRIAKLVELNAPPVIINNEIRMLQQSVDCLMGNELLPSRMQVLGSENRPLRSLMSILYGDFQREEKRVDWSGAARAVMSTAIDDHTVLVPQILFNQLKLSQQQPVLLAVLGGGGQFVAKLPRPHAESVMMASRTLFSELGFDAGRGDSVALHRPITLGGAAEAQKIFEGRAEPSVSSVDPALSTSGWFGSGSAEELLQRLAASAVANQPCDFRSAVGLLIAGTGSTQIAPDSKENIDQRNYLEVPATVFD